MLSLPLAIFGILALSYFLAKFVACPIFFNTSFLCEGPVNVGMWLIIFFVIFIISFITVITIIVNRFSSRDNLKNLSAFGTSKNKILQMVKDSNPNITDEELERIIKQTERG